MILQEAAEAAEAAAEVVATSIVELSGFDLFVPLIVSGLVVAARQFSAKLDGPAAYWWVLALNILAQVTAELSGGGGATAAGLGDAMMMGALTGGTVSVGLATAGKRVGLGKVIKPKRDSTR